MSALLDAVIRGLHRVKGPDRRGWYEACCPFHEDLHPSFGFTGTGFKCQACARAGSLRELAEHLGIEAVQPDRLSNRIAATYDYVDASGALLFQAVRLERPKAFRQRRPDGRGGWVWDLADVRRVLYRLSELHSAPRDQALFVVEGEKDADRLWAEGLPATTNPMGAGKWRPEYSEFLSGRAIVILPDNDDAGRRHAEQVAQSAHGVAAEVRILVLPGLPEKGDVSDWFDAGGTVEALLALVEDGPTWQPSPDDTEPDAPEFPLTDSGNGELFAHLYGDRVRYDHRRKRWLVWQSPCWSDDADGEVRRLAKMAVRHRGLNAVKIEDYARRTQVAKFAIQSEHRQRIDALLTQAQSEPPIADDGKHWDEDPLVLACANGVLDLGTGLLREGRPDDRLTLSTRIAFDPGAMCPRWLQFLDEVFEGNQELVDFIQAAVGYSLTGLTTEQCLFLCYGTGANGKSVFLSVLRMLAGGYAYNAPFSLFEMHQRNAIPNDIAALVNRRLVTSSETNEGTRLNEARVKALTGCDPLTARFLHAEFFTFEPEAKYWLAVNHKPTVRDDSHGFWRRVRLIPFNRQFAGASDDRGLTAQLRDELPGILAWAVRGTAKWRATGSLPHPVAVRAATDSYRAESDPLFQFTRERCVVGDDFSVGSSEIFRAYQAWGAEQGMKERELLNATTFGKRMAERFEKVHRNNGNRYVGIGLITNREPPNGADHGEPERWYEDESAAVKGSVKGFESDDHENEVFPLEDHSTRENPEKPFTTLHPFTDVDDEFATQPDLSNHVCKRCGGETDLPNSNLCEACRQEALRAVMKGQS